jgi:hypothetical protein
LPDAPQHDLPPYPWPEEPDPPPWQPCPPGGSTCLGSFGTPWYFKLSALRNRCIALGIGADWLETVGLIVAWANGKLSDWQSGGCDLEDPGHSDPDPTLVWFSTLGAPRMSVNVYRAAIHATYGPFEDLEHVFHLRAKSGVTQDTTESGLQALAARVGDAWSTFWNDTTVYDSLLSGTATKACFTSALAYDKIDMSYLTYPGDWLDEATKKVNPPVTVTPTTTWTFSSPLPGTNTTEYCLPFEVALCLTLLTDTAGRRTRGRVYLGGLTHTFLNSPSGGASTQGFFNRYPEAIGHRFGVDFVDGLHNDTAAQAELNIVSRIGGSSRGVGGVKAGHVPDSQRRRRWHMPENPALVWGSA